VIKKKPWKVVRRTVVAVVVGTVASAALYAVWSGTVRGGACREPGRRVARRPRGAGAAEIEDWMVRREAMDDGMIGQLLAKEG
jgi:hypothetical protein